MTGALARDAELLAKKRADFEAREAAAAQRRAELEEIRKREDAMKRQEDIRKEQERQEKVGCGKCRRLWQGER